MKLRSKPNGLVAAIALHAMDELRRRGLLHADEPCLVNVDPRMAAAAAAQTDSWLFGCVETLVAELQRRQGGVL